MRFPLIFKVTVLLIAPFIIPANAGEVTRSSDNSVTWAASPRGPWIDFNPDGTVNRIFAKYSTPVEFPDRRGINKAQIIAEEKAKAEIVRFMKQDVASVRVVTEIQNDLNTATQLRQSGGERSVKKLDSRVVAENLTEITSSFAAASLTGVIVLENGYDKKTEEAWVVVGISQKTVNAARAVGQMDRNSSKTDDLGFQESEQRRSMQRNW